MKREKTKKVWIVILSLLLIMVLAAGGTALYLRSLPSPLEAYDFSDCTVELYAKWTGTTYTEMTEIDTDVFRGGLQSIDVFPLEIHDPPAGIDGGPLHQFYVCFSDGSTLDVGIAHDYLVLGEKWYRCDPDTIGTLYWLETAYGTHYSEQYTAPAGTQFNFS